jgi:uncharacterized membrane protein
LKNSITIKHTIFIGKPKSLVWDYTQNYSNRPAWDDSVLSAEVIHVSPNRMVKLKLKGNTTMSVVYKLDDKPNKTTLKAIDIDSSFIQSAGGSWNYEDKNGGTIWTQVNTIVLVDSFFQNWFTWIFKFLFQIQTRRAMNKVKAILEKD